jgi:hypothetical protein
MGVRTNAWVILGAGLVLTTIAVRRPGADARDFAARENTSSIAQISRDTDATPVLVELFTSEGCSSCPPADSLLMHLRRTQPVQGTQVIVLEEHVDYWDRLGWKDPFSSETATARQNEYAGAFGGQQIYTPQMVVDGHAEFVGSSESDALRAVRAASVSTKPKVALSWTPEGQLSVSIQPLSNASHGESAQVYVAVTENMLKSDVKHGENSGRALNHDGVVRQFFSAGKIEAGAPGFSSSISVHTMQEWNRANLRAVVFVQEKHSRRVLAVAEVPFQL